MNNPEPPKDRKLNVRIEPADQKAFRAAHARWSKERKAAAPGLDAPRFSDWVRAALRFAAEHMR